MAGGQGGTNGRRNAQLRPTQEAPIIGEEIELQEDDQEAMLEIRVPNRMTRKTRRKKSIVTISTRIHSTLAFPETLQWVVGCVFREIHSQVPKRSF